MSFGESLRGLPRQMIFGADKFFAAVALQIE
jgi:hypothetical protein